jgi:AcrR family transcriptional regulator
VSSEAPEATTDRARPALASESRRKLRPGPGLSAQDVATHQLGRIHGAMIELVAEHGYQALKVRDLVHRAGVSTRAFYEHFSSKEDCFLQTHDLISRRATRRIVGAQSGERDWRRRSRLVFEEFAREIENQPGGARFALIETYAAGEVPLARAWRAERIFEGMLAESLARSPDGIVVPPMIVEGVVAGIAGVSRNRLLTGRVADLHGSSNELLDWALSYADKAAGKLAELDRGSVWRDTTLEPPASSSSGGDGEPWPSTGDRALILTAVSELAVEKSYACITTPRIRSKAGVSRRKFDAHFDGVEDCYLAALEQKAGEAFAHASRAQTAAADWPGGAYRAIAALCKHVSRDAFLAKVCLTDDFPPGPNGARSKKRLLVAAAELLNDSVPASARPSSLAIEALRGAVWSLFHHYVIRDWSPHREVSATLSYLILAPVLGAPAAISAIQAEQGHG